MVVSCAEDEGAAVPVGSDGAVVVERSERPRGWDWDRDWEEERKAGDLYDCSMEI